MDARGAPAPAPAVVGIEEDEDDGLLLVDQETGGMPTLPDELEDS